MTASVKRLIALLLLCFMAIGFVCWIFSRGNSRVKGNEESIAGRPQEMLGKLIYHDKGSGVYLSIRLGLDGKLEEVLITPDSTGRPSIAYAPIGDGKTMVMYDGPIIDWGASAVPSSGHGMVRWYDLDGNGVFDLRVIVGGNPMGFEDGTQIHVGGSWRLADGKELASSGNPLKDGRSVGIGEDRFVFDLEKGAWKNHFEAGHSSIDQH